MPSLWLSASVSVMEPADHDGVWRLALVLWASTTSACMSSRPCAASRQQRCLSRWAFGLSGGVSQLEGMSHPGCSSVWYEHPLWERGAARSNRAIPTHEPVWERSAQVRHPESLTRHALGVSIARVLSRQPVCTFARSGARSWMGSCTTFARIELALYSHCYDHHFHNPISCRVSP